MAHIPKKIYKFMKFNQYTLSAIIHNKIWHSKPEDFNDPQDTKFKLNNKLSRIELESLFVNIFIRITKYDRKTIINWIQDMRYYSTEYGAYDDNSIGEQYYKNQILSKIEKTIYGHFPKVGIACYSGSWKNTLLWSHYADSHKGICLEFETDKMKNTELKKVEYIYYNQHKITTSDLNLQIDSDTFYDDLHRKIIIQKNKEWQYENEYRSYIKLTDSVKDPAIFVGDSISSITFGMNCPFENTLIIISLLRERHNIKFYEVFEHSDSFKIGRRTINKEEYLLHLKPPLDFDKVFADLDADLGIEFDKNDIP